MGDGNTMISVLGLIIGVIGFATAWQVGRGLQEDLKGTIKAIEGGSLATQDALKASLAAIEKGSLATQDAVKASLAAIEKGSLATQDAVNGTLAAIEAAHKSIKEELH